MQLKRMGVMNVTPDSFSDGGEFFSPASLAGRLQFLRKFDAIDIGAESTAPMNTPLPWEAEWDRWQMVLPYLKDLPCAISADTYHPETIFGLVKFWRDQKLRTELIWNDVSGKFDDHVREFLGTGFRYVYCHNLAPTRELSGRHMDYCDPQLDLQSYFRPRRHPQVIFDPCLGFSKTYEQNWQILKEFGALQSALGPAEWLLGFSRKSFLKKKYGVTERDALDTLHVQEIEHVLKHASGVVWVRTHRPELLATQGLHGKDSNRPD